MQISSLRFPEILESYFFVSLSNEDLKGEVIDKLSKHKLSVKRIEELIK